MKEKKIKGSSEIYRWFGGDWHYKLTLKNVQVENIDAFTTKKSALRAMRRTADKLGIELEEG